MRKEENSGRTKNFDTQNLEILESFKPFSSLDHRKFTPTEPEKSGENQIKSGEDRTFSADGGAVERQESRDQSPEAGESTLLPPKQEMALAALLSGKTSKAAASVAGVTPRTLRNWKNGDPKFRDALDRQILENRSASAARLQTLADAAIAAVGKAVFDGDARIGFRLPRGLGYLPGNKVTIDSTDPTRLNNNNQHKADKMIEASLAEILGTK